MLLPESFKEESELDLNQPSIMFIEKLLRKHDIYPSPSNHVAERLPDHIAERLITSRVDVERLASSLDEPLNNPKLLGALARLILEIGRDLDLFDTIISDELSGRPISLLLWNLTNKKRERAGKPPAVGYFIIPPPLSYTAEVKRLEEFLYKSAVGERILVATEFIQSGVHIRSLLKAIQNLDSRRQSQSTCDIATVSILLPINYYKDIPARLYWGSDKNVGVTLHEGWSPQAGTIKGKVYPLRDPLSFDHTEVFRGRKNIALLTDAFYELTFLEPLHFPPPRVELYLQPR